MSAKIKFDFIPFPLAIVDESADLSLGEYRLLGYLLRHRFRVKAEKFRMTQDELLRGVSKSDGSRRDKGCGITSGRDLKTARESLVCRGWLVVSDHPDGMIYELHLSGDEEEETESAKCTGVVQPVESAKCCDSECKLFTQPVQNALNDNKELRRFKKVIEKEPLSATAEDSECSKEIGEDIIHRAFGYYCTKFERNPNQYTLTPERKKKALLRLRERTQVVGLKQATREIGFAIDNLAKDDFCVTGGYIDWNDQIFRSAEQFEKRLNWRPKNGNGKPPSKPTFDVLGEIRARNAAAEAEVDRQKAAQHVQ